MVNPKRYHPAPRFDQIKIAIRQTHMIQGARQVKAEIVTGLRHRRHMRVCFLEAHIASGESSGQHISLLFAWNHIQPHGQNISLLAVVLMLGCICNQA